MTTNFDFLAHDQLIRYDSKGESQFDAVLRSVTLPPVSGGCITDFQNCIAGKLPHSLLELWHSFGALRLFVDIRFGQWGLVIHDPCEAMRIHELVTSQRTTEFWKSDAVIGEFIGDADVLCVNCDPRSPEYESVFVATAIDKRRTWKSVSPNLQTFLSTYIQGGGDKFWE
jgi:hypothetical protein